MRAKCTPETYPISHPPRETEGQEREEEEKTVWTHVRLPPLPFLPYPSTIEDAYSLLRSRDPAPKFPQHTPQPGSFAGEIVVLAGLGEAFFGVVRGVEGGGGGGDGGVGGEAKEVVVGGFFVPLGFGDGLQ